MNRYFLSVFFILFGLNCYSLDGSYSLNLKVEKNSNALNEKQIQKLQEKFKEEETSLPKKDSKVAVEDITNETPQEREKKRPYTLEEIAKVRETFKDFDEENDTCFSKHVMKCDKLYKEIQEKKKDPSISKKEIDKLKFNFVITEECYETKKEEDCYGE